MTVVLLSSDLTVVSRVQGAAAGAALTVLAVSTAQEAVERCIVERGAMLIVDLAKPALDIGALVEGLKAGADSAPRLVAFGPHVHAERLAAAREAGCDEVMSRGQFFSQLDAVLDVKAP